MKIAYLIGEDLSSHPGLKYKIEGQIKAWESHGHEVYKVLHYKNVVLKPNEPLLFDVPVEKKKQTKISRIFRLSKQYLFISKALKSISPDITYPRLLYPAWKLADSFVHAGKLIVEINSDDKAEYYVKHFYVGIYNQLARQFFLKKADALVFVTNELSLSSSFLGFTNNREVIANGINCVDFPFVAEPKNSNPKICFIGSPNQLWHGLDRLIQLAEMLPESTIHIIGPSKDECLKLWGYSLANIIFHGYLSAELAKPLIANMDVGISTLALYRKKMEEACPLKSRQYLAQGIPMIVASSDPDIQNNESFCLQLPNKDNNVLPHKGMIIKFIDFCFGNSELRESARRFSIQYFDKARKEEKRLNFFAKVAGFK